MTGAKFRVCMIQLFLCFHKRSIPSEVLMVIETAVRISEPLYMIEAYRNPRNILRLYKCSWLHHELCSKLITNFHKKMTYYTFFGTYIHSLVAHAPQQMEIISLRSVNTENQERLFGQARRSASAASNRHPQNVLSTIILRLQAKATFKDKPDAEKTADSIVSKAGTDVPRYRGTMISKSFSDAHQRSWQVHLKRISHYLIVNKGVWWEETASHFHFFDGDDDPEFKTEGPQLRHFRTTSMKEVTQSIDGAWKQILENKVEIPTTSLQYFDGQGESSGSESQSPNKDNDPPTEERVHITSEGEDEETDSTNTEEAHNASDDVQYYDDLSLDQDTPNEPECYKFKTSHGLEIYKVLGISEDLKQFDVLRQRIKSSSTVSSTDRMSHNGMLYKLQLAVQHERTTTLESLRTIEQHYFQEHGTLPQTTDIPEHRNLTIKCKQINKLLRAWNISS